MRPLFFLLFIFCSIYSIAGSNLDSLWSVWSDKSQADTIRLQAIHSFAWDGYVFSKPDSAIYYTQLEYNFANESGNIKWKADALNTQGIALWIKGDYDSAMECHRKSLKIRKELGDKNGIASSLNNIGLLYNEKGEYATAINYYRRSLKICKENNNKKGMANALGNIGIVYSEQGNYAKAIEYYSRELKLKEAINDLRGMANVLNNIGVVYLEQNDFDKAIEYYSKSMKIREDLNDKKGLSLSYNNLGLIFNKLKQFEKAKDHFNRSLEINLELGDQKGISQSYNNLGITYKEQKYFLRAMDFYNKGLEINKKLDDKRSMSISLINIANLYKHEREYKKAVASAKEALELAQNSGSIGQIELAAKTLYECFKLIGQNDRALDMHELYINMRDSIQSEKNAREVIRQEYKYQFEKEALADSIKAEEARKLLDAKIKIQKKELKYQRNQKYILYGGVLLLVLFGIYIFNRYKKSQAQNAVIERQKAVVENAHREITDSIAYAKRIQHAILPPLKMVKKYLKDSFVMYKPKDVVAGDFYWLEYKDGKTLFAVADCTGHGVPGAMVSVVCNNGLNRAVREYGLTDPAVILDKTREIVISEFEKSDEEVKDGMDIALCSLEGNNLLYAGANNPLWIVRNNELIEFKADKLPIGKFDSTKHYTSHTITLEKGDNLYIFSDGYVDQFGGPRGKKFMAKPLKKLLVKIQDQSMKEQHQILENTFEKWRGAEQQVDDVCFVGVRI